MAEKPVKLSKAQDELLAFLVTLPPGFHAGLADVKPAVAEALERKGFAWILRGGLAGWSVVATPEGRARKPAPAPPDPPPPGFVSGTLTYDPACPIFATLDGVPVVVLIAQVAEKLGISPEEAGRRIGAELAEALKAGAEKGDKP